MRATVVHRAATAVRQWLCFALVATIPSIGSADTAKGLTWLQSQVQTGGQLASVSSAATVAQSRCEIARTLLELSGPGTAPAALTAALDSSPLAETVTEVLACTQWLQQQQSQIPRTSELQSRRRDTNGFAAFEGQTGPSALDTGWALQALGSQWSSAQTDPTLAWLQQQQKTDGSFSLGTGSDLLTTASVLRGLQDHRQRSATAAAIADKAASYLLAEADPAGHWQSNVGITALVYEAVHPYSGTQPALASAVQTWLLAGQATNGTWNNNDPWTTALALRALVLTGRAPVNPAQAALKLQFVDGSTGTPISGVQLTGTGAGNLSASSNVSGQIQVQGLAPGAYTLTATATGYSTVQISATLQTGKTTDLGTVQMLVPVSSTTAVISGTVRDSASGTPLAGVTISITGQAMTGTSDANGLYLINGVAPGAITLKASRTGYFDATGQANVLAGQTVNFSPSLVLSTAGGPGGTADCRILGTVTKAADGTPVAAATVTVSGANTGTATTDASGAYVLTGLASGDTRISVSQSGFDVAVANTRLNCSPQGNTALQYSPKLYPSTQAPVDANTASLSGVVMDAGTNQPIAAAQLTVTTNTNIVRNVASQADGRFTVSGLDGATAQLVVVATGYEGLNATYTLQPGQAIDLGQIRLRPPKVTQLTLDLQLQSVKRHTTQTDPQTLRVSGALQVQVRNAGTQMAPANVAVLAFQDGNGNDQYDPSTDTVLGQATLAAALGTGQSQTVTIDVAGLLPFRDAPIHVVVDPLGALAESDKANNVRSSAQDVLFVPQGSGAFTPKLKWHWDGSNSPYPTYNQVMIAPVVGRLLDTNGDGRIDERDAPILVFSTFTKAQRYDGEATLRVVNGVTGMDIYSIRDPSVSAMGGIVLADIDGDGIPEIVTLTRAYQVVAFRNTGEKIWTSAVVVNGNQGGNTPWGAPSVADIDMDGKAEIIAGQSVLNSDGSIRWKITDGYFGGAKINNGVPIAAQLDEVSGNLVIFGGAAYSTTGNLMWKTALDGFVAVARFGSEASASIALVHAGRLSRISATGQVLWTVSIPGGGVGGPPTIGDMDGDGLPDIGVAGAYAYSAYRSDGTLIWSKTSQDWSSQITGSTAFDFDGDGFSEILYADEIKFRAFDGRTGSVIYEIPNTSGTALEYPIVADVDADGHADIVVVSNDYASLPNAATYTHGVRVYEDANNSWVATRSIWNQHAYSITNINDDLSVPRNPEPSWKSHNTFRLNRRMDADPRAIADLTASYVRVADTGAQPGSRITVRLGNAGSYKVPTGTPVAIYNTDPALGQPTPQALVARGSLQTTLQPGAYEDLVVALSQPLGQLSPQGTLWIVADDDGTGVYTLSDFDRANNTAVADLNAIATNLQLGVATDKSLYAPADTAQFTATVHNAGSYARDALVRFTVLDALGNTVDVLPLGGAIPIQPGANATVAAPWPAASVLAGPYQVHAELITAQGMAYGSALAPFAIQAGTTGGASSLNSTRISTDRRNYHAAHTVLIDARVANLSANLLQENLTAITQVIAPDGQTVLTRAESIAQATPHSQRQYGYQLRAAALQPGTYQVQLQLLGASSYKRQGAAPGLLAGTTKAASDVELSFSTTSFTVMQGTGQVSGNVAGQLIATPAAVPAGNTATLQLQIANNGSTSLSGATVRVRVLDPTSGTALATFTQSGVHLAQGASAQYHWPWLASGAAGTVLPVAATIDPDSTGTEQPLAQTTLALHAAAPGTPQPIPLTWHWLLTLLLPALAWRQHRKLRTLQP